MKPRNFKTPTSPPDLEAELFCRLVARVLAWPCPVCGKPGLCACFATVTAGNTGREAEIQTREGEYHEQ